MTTPPYIAIRFADVDQNADAFETTFDFERGPVSAVAFMHAVRDPAVSSMHIGGSIGERDFLFQLYELGLDRHRYQPRATQFNSIMAKDAPSAMDAASYPLGHYHTPEAPSRLQTIPVHLDITGELLLSTTKNAKRKAKEWRYMYVDAILALLLTAGKRPMFVCAGSNCEIARLITDRAARREYTIDSQARLFKAVLQHVWRESIAIDNLKPEYAYPRHDDLVVEFDRETRAVTVALLDVYAGSFDVRNGAVQIATPSDEDGDYDDEYVPKPPKKITIARENVPGYIAQLTGKGLSFLCRHYPYLAHIYEKLMGDACPRADDVLLEASQITLLAPRITPHESRVFKNPGGDEKRRADAFKLKRFLDHNVAFVTTAEGEDVDSVKARYRIDPDEDPSRRFVSISAIDNYKAMDGNIEFDVKAKADSFVALYPHGAAPYDGFLAWVRSKFPGVDLEEQSAFDPKKRETELEKMKELQTMRTKLSEIMGYTIVSRLKGNEYVFSIEKRSGQITPIDKKRYDAANKYIATVVGTADKPGPNKHVKAARLANNIIGEDGGGGSGGGVPVGVEPGPEAIVYDEDEEDEDDENKNM